MREESVERAALQESARDYARRIVRAHQHAHGPREVRALPEHCAHCRDLIDAITHAVATREREARRQERERAVAYMGVLMGNHPHLADAYQHAAHNLHAALESEWQPLPVGARAQAELNKEGKG